MNHEQALANTAVTLLEQEEPDSAERILDILRWQDPGSDATTARYTGADYDYGRLDDLLNLNWDITYLTETGATHWTAHNRITGDFLTYVDGDVYPRDDRNPEPSTAPTEPA